MAGSQNPYYAREALRSMITNDLPALLNAIDTEIDDGIVLDDIANIYIAPLAAYDALPAIVMSTPSTAYPDQGRSDNLRYHEISLELFVASIEQVGSYLPSEVVVERVGRTMTALHDMIVANDTLLVSGTHNADMVIIRGVDFSPVFGLEGQTGAAQGAVMRLHVHFSTT